MLLDTTKESTDSKFELAFHILGNELFKLTISSESRYKNWAFFGVIVLFALVILVASIGPELVDLYKSINGSGA